MSRAQSLRSLKSFKSFNPSRRALLKGALGAVALAVVGCDDQTTDTDNMETPWGPLPSDDEPRERFVYGVASGDPRADQVTLWSALAQLSEPTLVLWRLATQPDLSGVVVEGEVLATPERGGCVKVLIEGLTPNTRYYYGFKLSEPSSSGAEGADEHREGERSHVGRTRTLPAPDDPALLSLSVGVTSCAAYNSGHFQVYRALAEDNELAVVLQLGDYIYEDNRYARPEVRSYGVEEEARELEGYRARYAQHRLDPDLQALHRAHPMISLWDDHEFANNACPSQGGEGEPEQTSGEAWEERKAGAMQAYHEWLPVALELEGEPLSRSFELGPFATLCVLDTRMEGRDPPLSGLEARQERFNEERKLITAEQESWLIESLSASSAPWRLIGQQVMMAQLQLRGALEAERERAVLVNLDQWDGFAAQRARLLTALQARGAEGVVVLAGDLHTSWASELSLNPSDPTLYHPNAEEVGGPLDLTGLPHGGALALECVTPSVSSPALAGTTEALLNVLGEANPHIKWSELTRRGYLKLTLSAEELEASWWLFDDTSTPTFTPPRRVAIARATPQRPRWEIEELEGS